MRILIGISIIAIALTAKAVLATETFATFPTVSGSNLNEVEVMLPDDFEGYYTIAVLAFKREQQELVNPWLEKLAALKTQDPSIDYYELPTLDKFNMLMRWWVDNGMRSGIDDAAQRERTITLYLDDKEGFLKALGISDESTIYTVLLTGDGGVIDVVKGEFSPDKWALLESMMVDLKK